MMTICSFRRLDDLDEFNQMKTSGLNVHYYFVCKRKLWLHHHQINFEQENDRVLQGKVLHERSYKRVENREVLIDRMIQIDLMDGYVGEVKSSRKMKNADTMQLLYYLYYLKNMGVIKKGKIHYPKEKVVEEVVLTEGDEKFLDQVLSDIQNIVHQEKIPQLVKKPYCTKCAYHDFCWVGELE